MFTHHGHVVAILLRYDNIITIIQNLGNDVKIRFQHPVPLNYDR